MIRAAFAGLLGLTLALVAGIATEFSPGDRNSAVRGEASPPTSSHVAAPPPATVLAADHTADWVETVLVPLPFSPSRRPPTVAASGPAAEIMVGMPRLTGILISPAGKRAIFAPGGGGKPLTATEGDTIGKWTVRTIESSAVTLSGPDELRVLHTTFENSTAPAQSAQGTTITAPTSLVVTDPAALLRLKGQTLPPEHAVPPPQYAIPYGPPSYYTPPAYYYPPPPPLYSYPCCGGVGIGVSPFFIGRGSEEHHHYHHDGFPGGVHAFQGGVHAFHGGVHAFQRGGFHR
jgi:hypothetical protein